MRESLRDASVVISVAALSTAAYVLSRRRRRRPPSDATVALRAKVVEDAPDGATVVEADGDVFGRVPTARAAVRRAISDRGEWSEVAVAGRDAWGILDALFEELPYYDAAGRTSEDGVYCRDGETVVVVDAVGLARQ